MIGIFLVVFMLVVAVFLSGDADLPLLLLPYKPVGAFHNKVRLMPPVISGMQSCCALINTRDGY